ncbi:MAG: hypothetical protein IJO03_08565 [Clostridia bacterium]|nr:hypothetical protein [Clostridia bacterium]
MKRNFKAIIAAMLAAIMAFTGLTAFAENSTPSELEWDFYGNTYYYDYAGELELGENEIDNSTSDYLWYTFDVQTAGFYYISYDCSNSDIWIGIPEKYENGKAYNEASHIYHGADDIDGIICYFESGENVAAFDIYDIEEDSTINVEFYGEEITSVTVSDSLILNYDIYEGEDENRYYVDAEATVEFSSGKTATKYELYCIADKKIVTGTNTLKEYILGKEYEVTIDVCEVSDFIEGAEVSNIENYLTVTEYYDGYNYNEPYGETLTVTFKDGTKGEVCLNDDEYLTLPNGKKVWCYTDVEIEGDTAVLTAYVAGTAVASYDCTIVPASTDENIDNLKSSNAHNLHMVSRYIRQALITVLECDSVDEFLNFGAQEAADRLYWAIDYFLDIFRETFALVSYLMF